ncbi:MAG TPA: PDZ domain-containing protein [Planctomycetota bacterium]|nr:PDZ domain-containing protein [Planctomycetota bacterium]
MTHTPLSAVRAALTRCPLFAVLVLLPIGRTPCCQERAGEPASAPARSRELDEIQRTLSALQRRVDDLQQQEPAATAAPRRREGDNGAVLPESWAKAQKWRSIGPAGMGGRVTAIAVCPTDTSTWWVATAGGGLVKTVNNGVTFEHQFDHENVVSIGDVAVAPSNADIVWVGTGESNPRNSVSYGDGVYKSIDGGKTWLHMGLDKTFQIGRIAIHPSNPDIVYVGAMGRCYGPNEERGLFKTTDGGATWQKVLWFDEQTGVIDVAMSPRDPDTLIVAMWARQRDGFDSHRGTPPIPEGYDGYDPAKKWGPHAGLYKTTDGGRTFHKLTNGLPSSSYGRCDVDWYAKDPDVVYAIVDCEKIGMGPAPSKAFLGVQGEGFEGGAHLVRVTPKGPAAVAGLADGDVVVAVDGQPIEGYANLTATVAEHQPNDTLKLRVRRGEQTLDIAVKLDERPISAAGTGPVAAWLGLAGEEVPDGLRITDVTENSPAERAGAKVDDVLTSFGDEPISTSEQLSELVQIHKPGDRVVMSLERGDEKLQLTANLTERGAGAGRRGGGGGGRGGFGGGGFAGGGSLGTYFGAFAREQDDGTLSIVRVGDDSAAQKAGLEEGDVVKEIDGTAIATAEAMTELLGAKKEGETATFKVERKKEQKEIAVVLAASADSQRRPFGYMYAGQMPNAQNQQGPDAHEYGGIYRSADGGESWTRINSLNPRPMYFSQIRVDPSDERYLYVAGVGLHRSSNGGKTFTADGGDRVHSDFHALWIDPHDGRHMITGCDGGFYASWDRARRWEHLNHLALGQFYHVTIDSRRPYHVYGGLQDNGSWGGPSRTFAGPGIVNADWISVGGGDGFVCRTDPFDPDIVYSESQDGAMSRRNIATGESRRISPRPTRGVRYRFNWNTPFVLSAHNAGIFYCGGNYVFRSLARGDDLKVISPEVSRTGRGSATAVAESPSNADVLWCGTDDGNLWVTRDGGGNWTNVADKVGLPGPRWVATIEPSRFVEGRCYVAFDAHRSDDDQPYTYVTEDFGETWRSLRHNLPVGSTRCLREDLVNANLLFCGTEFAAFASLDRGENWVKFNGNLPTVAVHELALQPNGSDLVAATHGRSIWITDIGPLRQMTGEAVEAAAFLYEPTPVVRWHSEPSRGTGSGAQHFVGANPGRGAVITYSLTKAAEKASIRILDYTGSVVRELEAKNEPGLHQVNWDLTARAPQPAARGGRGAGGPGGPVGAAEGGRRRGRGGPPAPANAEPGTAGAAAAGADPTARAPARPGAGAPLAQGRPGQGGRGGGGPGFGRGRAVPLGLYRVVLDVDGRLLEQTIRIEADPTLPADVAATVGLEGEQEPASEEQERESGEAAHIRD